MLNSKLILGNDVFNQVDEAAWNGLAQGGITDTPFQTYAYQRAWWSHLGKGELVSVLVHDTAEQLVGLGCFYIENGRLFFNASKEETDYLDILVKEAHAEAVWAEIVSCLCCDACPDWDVMDLYNIPAASISRQIIPRLAHSRGFSFVEEVAEVCPIIPLESDFDGYLAGIDKKQRHEIRRKMRKAAGAGAELEIVDSLEAMPTAVDDFLALLQKSSADKQAWLNEGRTAVFHDVAEAALKQGTLLLMFMVVDGERISALFNFLYNGRVWVYNSGIDISQHGNLSLGVVLTAHAIQHGTVCGCGTFDFLRGNETYKYRFGAKDSEIFRYQLTLAQ